MRTHSSVVMCYFVCLFFMQHIIWIFFMVCTLNVLTISLTTGFKVVCCIVTMGHVPKWRSYKIDYYSRGGIAQLVKQWTERPGTILTQFWFPGAARDFSPRVNCQCRLSGLMAFVQPQCAVTSISIYIYMCVCVCVLKIPNASGHTSVWTHDNTAHSETVIEMGSAALGATVALPR